MATLEERFASLEESNRLLSDQVIKLVAALQVIKDIEERGAATEAKVDLVEIDSIAREQRTRTAMGALGIGLGVLLPLVSILVYWALLIHVDDLLSQQQSDRFQSCTIRNAAAMENASREEALSRIAQSAAERELHAGSAVALRKAIIDCTRYQTSPGR